MNDTTPTHLHSPLGDQRERAVPCAICRRATFNIYACCTTHCDCAELAAAAGLPAATDAVVADIHGTLDGVTASVPIDVDAANARDIYASIGIARLLADMARENPVSESAWQMLTACLVGIQA